MPISRTGVDEDGFLVRPEPWRASLALDIVVASGIKRLEEEHRRVLRCLRTHCLARGYGPAGRSVSRETGLDSRVGPLFGNDLRRAGQLAALPSSGEEANLCVRSVRGGLIPDPQSPAGNREVFDA